MVIKCFREFRFQKPCNLLLVVIVIKMASHNHSLYSVSEPTLGLGYENYRSQGAQHSHSRAVLRELAARYDALGCCGVILVFSVGTNIVCCSGQFDFTPLRIQIPANGVDRCLWTL